MTRIAHCSCGSLRAETAGEPIMVGVCHCIACQRRTGAPFGVNVFFSRTQVQTEGDNKVFIRGNSQGRPV